MAFDLNKYIQGFFGASGNPPVFGAGTMTVAAGGGSVTAPAGTAANPAPLPGQVLDVPPPGGIAIAPGRAMPTRENTLVQVVTVADITKAYNVQAYLVPVGANVFIKALVGNTKPIHVAQYKSAVLSGPYNVLNPGDEMMYPVDNTGHIWIGAEVQDEGAEISVRR